MCTSMWPLLERARVPFKVPQQRCVASAASHVHLASGSQFVNLCAIHLASCSQFVNPMPRFQISKPEACKAGADGGYVADGGYLFEMRIISFDMQIEKR